MGHDPATSLAPAITGSPAFAGDDNRAMIGAMDGLYNNETPLPILFVTGFLGGGAAWLAGRAIAQTWRPMWYVVAYMALLGGAVRFIHFALFGADLLTALSYAVDTFFLIFIGCLAWRVTRVSQMVTQYDWLYERTGPFSWRERVTAIPGGGDKISG